MTCGGHWVNHTCESCGADDLLEGVAVEPYTCIWCHKARQTAEFMRRPGDKELVPWQLLVLSRWLRHDAESPGGALHQWYQPATTPKAVPYYLPEHYRQPPVQVLDERPGVYNLPLPPPHQGWGALRTKLTGEYSALWWQLVYAATPTYRRDREGGAAPLPTEYQAEQATLEIMVEADVLVRDPCPDEYSDDD